MKDGDQKKIIRKSVAKVLKEMCGKGHKRDPHRDIEIYEDAYDLYTREPEEPDNPEYMRGWEDGYEAGKIGAAMYGEAKQTFPGNEVELQESDEQWKKDNLLHTLASDDLPRVWANLKKGNIDAALRTLKTLILYIRNELNITGQPLQENHPYDGQPGDRSGIAEKENK